ncbi:MAG: hypothetical protein HBSAPP02_05470 [Phycisphaerae bacterium]|nr:MAG: hypothetical protein HBSAPP02_05470 [Phycisphaerae bacterium]
MTETKRHRVKPIMTDRARALRAKGTKSERYLWKLLRSRQFEGMKFRRQHPIGPYIADFYCADAKLVIELDGISHDGRGEYDDRRREYLERLGLRVIKMRDDELFADPQSLATEILRVTRKLEPSPRPSP